MDSEMLREELKRLGIDERSANLGGDAYCEECFNLLRRPDGRWEIFYGERGQKTNVRIFDTEEEASKALLKLLRGTARRKEKKKLSFFSCRKCKGK